MLEKKQRFATLEDQNFNYRKYMFKFIKSLFSKKPIKKEEVNNWPFPATPFVEEKNVAPAGKIKKASKPRAPTTKKPNVAAKVARTKKTKK